MDEQEFIRRLQHFAREHEDYVRDYREFRQLLRRWLARGPDAPATADVATRLFDTLIQWGMAKLGPFPPVGDERHEAAVTRLTRALNRNRNRLRRINEGHPAHARPELFARVGADVVQALFGVLDAPEVRIAYPSHAMLLLTGRCVALSSPVREGLRRLNEYEDTPRIELHIEANNLYQSQLPLDKPGAAHEERERSHEERMRLMRELLCISRGILAAMPVPPVNRLPRGWRGVEPARLCDCVLHDLGRNGP
ncbi:MAG TPA: hypothetical protein ENK20_00080 [Chromatiales bacterium]|nr:hypothetical protein [Chromatiales bacterium]